MNDWNSNFLCRYVSTKFCWHMIRFLSNLDVSFDMKIMTNTLWKYSKGHQFAASFQFVPGEDPLDLLHTFPHSSPGNSQACPHGNWSSGSSILDIRQVTIGNKWLLSQVKLKMIVPVTKGPLWQFLPISFLIKIKQIW